MTTQVQIDALRGMTHYIVLVDEGVSYDDGSRLFFAYIQDNGQPLAKATISWVRTVKDATRQLVEFHAMGITATVVFIAYIRTDGVYGPVIMQVGAPGTKPQDSAHLDPR